MNENHEIIVALDVPSAAEAAAAEHMDDLEYLLANTGSRGASTSVNETGTSSHIGRLSTFRWPYQAKVMKTLESTRSPIGMRYA